MARKVGLLFLFVFSLIAVNGSPYDGRVIGGVPAATGEFPYVVTVSVQGSHKCGGFIYNDRWVVTVASCVDGVSINRIEVTVADLNFLDNDVDEEKFVISTVRFRNDFNSETGANNLALLEVARPMNFGSNVNYIYYDNESDNGSNGVVMGWGATLSSGPPSTRLRKINVSIKGNCDAYGSSTINLNIMICAGSASDASSPCDYDEGSPLVQDGLVIGIVAKQKNCGQDPYYSSIYTRLSAYCAWFEENAGLQTNRESACSSTTTESTSSTTTTITESTSTSTITDSTTTLEPTTQSTTTESTTSTSTERTTTPVFACPSDNGFFPIIPGTCSSEYYNCVDGTPYVYKCPGDSVFDPIVLVCVPPSEASCSLSTYKTPPRSIVIIK